MIKRLIVFLVAFLCYAGTALAALPAASTQQCLDAAGTWEYPGCPGCTNIKMVITDTTGNPPNFTGTVTWEQPAQGGGYTGCSATVTGTWETIGMLWDTSYTNINFTVCELNGQAGNATGVSWVNSLDPSTTGGWTTGWHGCMGMVDEIYDPSTGVYNGRGEYHLRTNGSGAAQCKVPTGESHSAFASWLGGVALFSAKFSDTSFDYSGRITAETLGAPSGCIPTGTNPSPSVWYADIGDYSVGPPPGTFDGIGDRTGGGSGSWVNQIRMNLLQGLPCTMSTSQAMSIDCDDGSGNFKWSSAYETHTIKEVIAPETFSVNRNISNGDWAGPIMLGVPRAAYIWDETPLCPMFDHNGVLIAVFEGC